MREETRCRHMGYSFRLTARVLLYAPYFSWFLKLNNWLRQNPKKYFWHWWRKPINVNVSYLGLMTGQHHTALQTVYTVRAAGRTARRGARPGSPSQSPGSTTYKRVRLSDIPAYREPNQYWKHWRKEIFYLTMHSSHFILQLYGKGTLR